MALTAPAVLKAVQPFLNQAALHAERDACISYYCKQWAAQQGMEIYAKLPPGPEKTDAQRFLGRLMDTLEAEKAMIEEGPEEAQEHIKAVATRLFGAADAQERASEVDKGTYQRFYAASTLFSTLKQFGDIDPTIEQMIKWARFHSMQIRKALDGGYPYVSKNEPHPETGAADAAPGEAQPPAPAPAPPPPAAAPAAPAYADPVDALIQGLPPVPNTAPFAAGGAPNQVAAPAVDRYEAQLKDLLPKPPAAPPAAPAAAPAAPAGPSAAEAKLRADLQAAQQSAAQAHARVAQLEQEQNALKAQVAQLQAQLAAGGGGTATAGPVPGFHPSMDHILEAQKMAKFAVSSLQFKDAGGARENMLKAINILNGR
eukprot:TRINITY_DN17972_c1_g1_i1.p2 TRINITY_DN17972_c1_g1~~TRINITY_DN17972_c1_g1_i1.p2  ORF type:complete len:371 (+),score=106.02 TRINITY_DN17972_c1_g1_i1:87-1199(+)